MFFKVSHSSLSHNNTKVVDMRNNIKTLKHRNINNNEYCERLPNIYLNQKFNEQRHFSTRPSAEV